MAAPIENKLPEDLTHDAITADYRVFQRKGGHRYSLDDVLTAAEAARWTDLLGRPDGRILDLGCGLGSVLVMLAWRFPLAQLNGIEAQPESAALARLNLRRNGIKNAQVHHADFRHRSLPGNAGAFDLITGTPPYFPLGSGTASPDPQRAAARFELRGGVEDYLDAALRASKEGSRIVLCASFRAEQRVRAAAKQLPLVLDRCVTAIPRPQKAPLFQVWSWRRCDSRTDPPEPELRSFVARNHDGTRSAAYHKLRAEFGLGPLQPASSDARGAGR